MLQTGKRKKKDFRRAKKENKTERKADSQVSARPPVSDSRSASGLAEHEPTNNKHSSDLAEQESVVVGFDSGSDLDQEEQMEELFGSSDDTKGKKVKGRKRLKKKRVVLSIASDDESDDGGLDLTQMLGQPRKKTDKTEEASKKRKKSPAKWYEKGNQMQSSR